MYIILDTETNGLYPPVFLMSVSAIFTDDKFHPKYSIDLLIRPLDDKYIGASHIHGITKETYDKYGIDVANSMNYYRKLLVENIIPYKDEAILVGHNLEFDLDILNQTNRIYNIDFDMFSMKQLDTMKTIGKRFLTKRGRPKWGKLAECFQMFYNRDSLIQEDLNTGTLYTNHNNTSYSKHSSLYDAVMTMHVASAIDINSRIAEVRDNTNRTTKDVDWQLGAMRDIFLPIS